jgi:glutamate synthase domain-containing protein 2
MTWLMVLLVLVAVLAVLGFLDLVQTRHAIRRNFPIVGRLRYLLERVGPEVRQYIVTDNDEERPFSRDQRRWVYASSKQENPYFGFGTDNTMAEPQYVLIRHSAFPHEPAGHPDLAPLPAGKVLGEWRSRRHAFRPASVVNISGMSYGSLSARAVEALNRGAALAGCLHNTGEGGISPFHLSGGELVFQLGTGYFGARDLRGNFDLDLLLESTSTMPIRAIEVKLSQGAKPGLGGVLPAAKVTREIARIRGVPVGVTVHSPSRHAEFDSIPTMIDFVERLADATGLPVGIKSAVGQRRFWGELADEMKRSGRGPDFITIDGGEGGTGAAPLVFADNVSLPFRQGFAEVFSAFASRHLQERVVWIGSGRLGFPGDALLAMVLGVDLINVAREAMLSIGCVQAQKCHTGRCPTGVATQSRWLMRGLDPTDKAARCANYVAALRAGLQQLANACGHAHPAMVGPEAIDVLLDGNTMRPLWDEFGYDPSWQTASRERLAGLPALVGESALPA